METNTRHLIERAEHCIRTDQPRMAMLYMDNALKHNAIDRIQYKSGKSIEQVWESISQSLKPMADTIQKIGEGMVRFATEFFEAYKKALAEQAEKEREAK